MAQDKENREKIIYDRYKVTDSGDVISLKTCRSVYRYIMKNGYQMVVLMIGGQERKSHLVHRLVAIHFIENPRNLPYVNHIDGDKLNNHYTNLEWCTQKENIQHAINVLGKGVGYKNGVPVRAKLTAEKVLEIRKLYSDKNISYQAIGDLYSISGINISYIIRNKTWKNI